MELDLVTRWTLWFFGSFLVAGALGFLVAKLASFELGLGFGMLIPGIVSLSFTLAFVHAYRELSFDPRRTIGIVVDVEDRPVAGGTTPVAIVEYVTSDGGTRRIDGLAASSLHTGDEVVVVPRVLGAPRIGTPRDLMGGAIASMLFGTFPLSTGIFFVVTALVGELPPRDAMKRARRQALSYPTMAANLLMVSGILATPFFSDPVAHAIMLGFGVVALCLWVHVVQGIRMRADLRWTLGVAVVAINFSAWVVALWFLTDPNAGW